MAIPVIPVTFILGGGAYVSAADWASGAVSMRAYTKRGKPRNRRGSSLPLWIGRRLTIEDIGGGGE